MSWSMSSIAMSLLIAVATTAMAESRAAPKAVPVRGATAATIKATPTSAIPMTGATTVIRAAATITVDVVTEMGVVVIASNLPIRPWSSLRWKDPAIRLWSSLRSIMTPAAIIIMAAATDVVDAAVPDSVISSAGSVSSCRASILSIPWVFSVAPEETSVVIAVAPSASVFPASHYRPVPSI